MYKDSKGQKQKRNSHKLRQSFHFPEDFPFSHPAQIERENPISGRVNSIPISSPGYGRRNSINHPYRTQIFVLLGYKAVCYISRERNKHR
ncbi:uncharacterized protein LOC133665740 isoform X2 [Apis cerana]|uniref:uncharacterized protein LOC133665740 isoform X2 n=1 Tax=Apis cerana TaxID=7461 RepID=UPI002B22621C|nr:uncharacterized protein LOC133665740 isoform X2 [Apis cerana]